MSHPSFLSSSLRRVGAFAVAFALLLQLSPFGMLPVAMANDTTTIVEWDFPDGSADTIADGGIAANESKEISVVGPAEIDGYYEGSEGGNDKAASANGWNVAGDKYWQIEFTTAGYTGLTLSSKQYGSTTGPKDFKVQYKIGEGSWEDVPNTTIKITTAESWATGVLTDVDLSACDNKSSVYLRWIMTSNDAIGSGTVAPAGTNRIDDIVVTGVSGGGATVYVDDDADCGGSLPCYSTIQAAITAANTGDTINVAAGNYGENPVINKQLTLIGANANVDPAGSTDREESESIIDGTITITGSGATLNGFKVTGGRIFIDGADGVTVEYNISVNSPTRGIGIDIDSPNAQILYNTISSPSEEGIWVYSASGAKINHNNISGVTGTYESIPIINHGGTDIEITYNTISGGAKGINYWGGGGNVVISYNQISGTTYEGIQTDKKATIQGNVINGGKGIHLGYYDAGSAESTIIDNQISNSEAQGILVDDNHAKVTISDNIISNTVSDGIALYPATVASADDKSVITGNTITATKYNGIIVVGRAYTEISDNTLTGCNYYGGDGTGDWDYAGIHVEGDSDYSTITGNTVSDGINGIQTWSNNVTISNNEIYGMGDTYADTKTTGANGTSRTYKNSAILIGSNWGSGNIDPTGTIIQNNNIHGNYWGLFYSADLTNGVTAELNYWGHLSGPTHSTNPGGSGDEVSDNVDYSPWIETYPDGSERSTNIQEETTFPVSDNGTVGGTLGALNYSITDGSGTGGSVTITQFEDDIIPDPAPSGGFTFAGNYYELETDMPNGTFEATLIFSYTEDPTGFVNGVPEADLQASYYDGSTWIIIHGGILDTGENTFEFEVDHFTPFSLVGVAMDVSATDDFAPVKVQSGMPNVGIIDLVFTNSLGSADTITKIIVTSGNTDNLGVANDYADVLLVKLFKDTNNNGTFEPTEDTASTVTATFDSETPSLATFSGLNISVPTGESTHVFVVYDVATPGAEESFDKHILDASIAAGGITMTTAGTNADIEGLNSGGETEIDDTPPTVLLTDDDADYIYNSVTYDGLVKAGDPADPVDNILFTATFDETMVDVPQITIDSEPGVTGSTTTGMETVDPDKKVWTYLWEVPNYGDPTDPTVNITVAGEDLAGNPSTASNELHFIYDGTPPTLTTITGTDAGPVQSDTINVTVNEWIGLASSDYDFSSDDTCDDTDFTAPVGFTSGDDFYITGDLTDYLCARAIDDAGHISYEPIGWLNTDNTSPTITGGVLDNSNDFITVNFSEGVYTNAGSGDLAVGDFDIIFLPNGGTATGVTIDSVVHTAGALSAVLNLTVTGTPSGQETIEIKPADGSSIYDEAGNAMLAGETTTPKNLHDELAPTITNVTSNKANGAYGVGATIDIDVTFSEPVTSTEVIVTLDTGRTCTFAVSDSASGTCDYVVQTGDTSGDLEVSDISGTIIDDAGYSMTNFVPDTNLAANKDIVIDTTTPDIVAVDAGADSTDRVSLTSGTWFKADAIGDDDLVSFSWVDASSLSDDTFYYELNSDSGNTITGDEATTTDNFIDLILITEGTNYFHVSPKNGAGTWGTERIFEVKYDKSAPTTYDSTAGMPGNNGWYTWYTSSVTVTITIIPYDGVGSGVVSTVYCIDTDDTCTPTTVYTVPFVIFVEGTNYVRYFSTDNAGNVQATQSLTVKIDKTDPIDGSVSHTDGSTTDLTIAVAVDPGTDATSGMSTDDDDYLLKYRSVTLTGDTCGTFIDDWADAGVTEIAAATNYDFASTTGNCYQFRYTVADVAGNETTYTSDDTTKVDTVNPTALTFSPSDNETGVTVNMNLIITFDEDVQAGTGNIIIKKSADDSVVATIPVGDAQVTFFGGTVTINPTADLADSTSHYILIDAGAITDLAGNPYAGFSDKTVWNFTTVVGENVENTIILEEGWNVFSTPRVLDSINFSNGGTNVGFYKLEGGQWDTTTTAATTANIQPLEGFMVNNTSGDIVYAYLDYTEGLTSGQKLFTKTLGAGWNIVGVADKSFEARNADYNGGNGNIGYTEVSIDSAFDSLLGQFANIIDYTDDFADDNSNAEDSYEQINSTETAGKEFEEFKAYPVFIRQGGASYGGSQKDNEVLE